MIMPRLLRACTRNFTGLLTTALLVTVLFTQVGIESLFAQQKVSGRVSMTPEREAAGLAFAKEHHEELSSLLLQLKEMSPGKYESAISELFRTSERLSRYKDRLPERYSMELELWKIDSRVRLLVARSASGMEEETREQAKKLLMERNQLRKTLYQAEQKKLQERLKRLEEQVAQLETESESIADRDLDRLMKSVRSRSITRKKTVNSKSQTTARQKGPNQKEASRNKKSASNKKSPPEKR
ncbi:DUF342 domain-containing protein [Thalassoglobus polymorphus]|uniref:Uncharacterized protein n=1 Tax=Thalassoglobus polymorphus TaxID=2527994 RepID=A0A517QRZ9_9PLAN|nr:DUF342 domain-containing protein [Thalassoglobus polymorphus]QDT34398.1 hypothetical protein Mal48_36580 [Thalassoglobus polymorphus]